MSTTTTRKILTERKKRKAKKILNIDKENLVLGQWYWTYYYFPTSRGNKFKDYLGVFMARPIEITHDEMITLHDGKNKRFVEYIWEVSNMKFSKTSAASYVQNYLNGYGLATCYEFFEQEEDCIESHNKSLKDFASDLNTYDRGAILDRLINEQPKMSKIETESRDWIKTLDKQQRKYLRWVKEFYEDEI